MVRRREIRLSRRAEADLEGIYTYTVQQWSAAQAIRYVTELNVGLQALAIGQILGRARSDLAEGYLSRPIGAHLIIYREMDDALFVVRILHASMDVPRHLP